MKSEFEKMRSAELYHFHDPEIMQSLTYAKALCHHFNTTLFGSDEHRATLRKLIPGIPDDSTICPPFYCDHGNGIRIGSNVFINYDCVILDGAYVTLGDHVKIGPKCQIVTVNHPIDHEERRKPCETGLPITIDDDTWLGTGVIVCPGVKIGKRCIIAAGAVVIHDIPDDCMAAGNPAVVKKKLK